MGSRGLLRFLNPLIPGMLNSPPTPESEPAHFRVRRLRAPLELEIAELAVMAGEKIAVIPAPY